MKYTLLDATAADWPAQIDELCAQVRPPNDSTLFPFQFLKVTLPAIGGTAIVAGDHAVPQGVGFVFPRDLRAGRKSYTLRLHSVAAGAVSSAELAAAAQHALGADVVPYDPLAQQRYAPTHNDMGGYDIGRPNGDEAAAIPAMQQEIWHALPGFVYPADLHSCDFRPGSSLVARVAGRVAGVVFGFYRFGGHERTPWWGDHRADLRIESQLLGVDPQFRRFGLGFALKQQQRVLALAEEIDIVHWTVDPLQYPNALLNIAKLGAVAFDFYPNYYPFRNVLNQLAPSRFRLTWLLRSPRVVARLAEDSQRRAKSLAAFPGVLVLHEGATLNAPTSAPFVAIEIPGDWTALQASDLPRAARWRATTDEVFAHLVGSESGKYVIMDVAVAGDRRFIVGRRVTSAAMLFEEEL